MVGTISVLHLRPGGGRSDIVGMQANGSASPSGYTSNRFSRMSSMIFFKVHVQAKCGDVNTSTGHRIWFSKYKDNYLHFWVSNLGIAGSCQKLTGKIINTSLSQMKTSAAEIVGGGVLLVGPIWDTTPRHTSISGTMVFKTPISALEFMSITS